MNKGHMRLTAGLLTVIMLVPGVVGAQGEDAADRTHERELARAADCVEDALHDVVGPNSGSAPRLEALVSCFLDASMLCFRVHEWIAVESDLVEEVNNWRYNAGDMVAYRVVSAGGLLRHAANEDLLVSEFTIVANGGCSGASVFGAPPAWNSRDGRTSELRAWFGLP